MSAPASGDAHATAVVSLLDINTPATLGVYRSEGPKVGNGDPDGYLPFLVVHPQPGAPEGTLGDRHRDLLQEFQVTAVGSTPRQAQWAADTARVVLLTMLPAVAGRAVQPLWQVDAPPVQRDDSFSPPLFYAPVVYQLRSGPT